MPFTGFPFTKFVDGLQQVHLRRLHLRVRMNLRVIDPFLQQQLHGVERYGEWIIFARLALPTPPRRLGRCNFPSIPGNCLSVLPVVAVHGVFKHLGTLRL